MLTKVEARTDQGAMLGLPLQDIPEGYSVLEIEGLDPVKATLVSSSFALLDGAQYQASRREPRNIKLKLGLETVNSWNSSIPELRTRLYGFFMPKSHVSLRFYMSDGLTVDISCRVESLESVLFAQEPEVSISLMCFDPDFYDPTEVVVNGNTTALVNEMLVNYDGSIETGAIFTLNVNRVLPSFTIYNRAADDTVRSLDFVKNLGAGDVLAISTVSGAKGASLIASGGLGSSALYAISPYSDWINLYPGENNIRILAGGLAIPYTIRYTNKYGGL